MRIGQIFIGIVALACASFYFTLGNSYYNWETEMIDQFELNCKAAVVGRYSDYDNTTVVRFRTYNTYLSTYIDMPTDEETANRLTTNKVVDMRDYYPIEEIGKHDRNVQYYIKKKDRKMSFGRGYYTAAFVMLTLGGLAIYAMQHPTKKEGQIDPLKKSS